MAVFMHAKKDFYYGFIDSNSQQISQENKDSIWEGFTHLEQIKQIAKEGKVDEAYERLKRFKERKATTLLRSDIILTEADLMLKKRRKSFAQEAEVLLEDAINRSYIIEDDIPKAYMLLIELKLSLNKSNDAKYFIDILSNSFVNPLVKAYGKIYEAKLHVFQNEYERAIGVLYEILTKTSNLDVATVVADELYDVYILNNQREDAYKLAQQVIEKNIEYYANDSYLAMLKVKKLLRNDMPKLSSLILEALLKRTKNMDAIEEFKFLLAQSYMQQYERGDMDVLLKAKELYTEIFNDFPKGKYAQESKMFIDEILMREGKIEPAVVNSKYGEFASMQQKVLLQEILNHVKRKEYELILKAERIYQKISQEVFERFGFNDLDEVLNWVRKLLITHYLKEQECENIGEPLQKSTKESILLLIEENDLKYEFFECLLQNPNEENFNFVNDSLFDSRDARVYFYLEQLAYALEKYDEALDYSNKVAMMQNQRVLEEEFLYRFQILHALKNPIALRRFFNEVFENGKNMIEKNLNNPVIIDFFYQYYFYLKNMNEPQKAYEILKQLNAKQNEYKAYIYSPFVEIELSREQKELQNYEQAWQLLEQSIENTRRIKNDELAEIYYEQIKIAQLQNNDARYETALQACQSLDATTQSLYKKMCDEM
jgi:predicted negative regulator of RcsB-dependent stress response